MRALISGASLIGGECIHAARPDRMRSRGSGEAGQSVHEPGRGHQRGRRRAAGLLGRAADGLLPRRLLRDRSEDAGSHTVCAIVTAEFLRFSRLAGNDLSTPAPHFGFAGPRARRPLVRLRRPLARGGAGRVRSRRRPRGHARTGARGRADRDAARPRLRARRRERCARRLIPIGWVVSLGRNVPASGQRAAGRPRGRSRPAPWRRPEADAQRRLAVARLPPDRDLDLLRAGADVDAGVADALAVLAEHRVDAVASPASTVTVTLRFRRLASRRSRSPRRRRCSRRAAARRRRARRRPRAGWR